MKKQLLLASALLITFSAFSQTPKKTRPARHLVDVSTIMNYKYGASESAIPINSNGASHANLTRGSKKNSSAIVWNSFTSSMNIYGSSNSYVKPLQWNDELNAVTFIHRKSRTYVSSPTVPVNAENGTIVTMISKDCGENWDSTCMWVNATEWARYPGGAIYNPPGNTNIDSAYMVGSGATTQLGATDWTGNWYASKKLGAGTYNNAPSTLSNAVQYMPTAGPYSATLGRHDFAAFGFSATDDGKMRVLAGITNYSTTPSSDTALMLVTGVFNNGVFNWSGRHFPVPVTINARNNTANFSSRPMMAWNEQGTVGYIVVMGARIGASGSNVGFQPIVYKTLDAGLTWILENGIDFNSNAFNDVKRPLVGVTNDSTLKVPNFFWGEGMDCTVDAGNKLHIFSTIISHPSDHKDSLDFIVQFKSQEYLWAHERLFHPYLYDFIYDGANTSSPSWSHILVDSMSSEAPSATEGSPGYDFNPWDKDGQKANAKFRQDARLQMSRTADGKRIVYTWSESDTSFTDAQTSWNILPNIKARLLNVQTGKINPIELDLTGEASEVLGHASCHFVSPKCKLVSSTDFGDVLMLPITVSNSDPYSQLGPNTHWYACASLEFLYDGVGLAENTLNSVKESFIYPNPTKSNATLAIDLKDNSKIKISVMNLMGQQVKSKTVEGSIGSNAINFELDGLASGIYLVNVTINNASTTKKLIIE
ncbi:hypothetical protein CNR22_07640 [Sphingobacteriaceae bacterium]|nr:hypothetical protein CNR22_07640 [Sphingobacteriaceae bacterium]